MSSNSPNNLLQRAWRFFKPGMYELFVFVSVLLIAIYVLVLGR